MSQNRLIRAAAIAAFALSLSAANAFASFQISPITQDFEPSGRGATQNFQIINDRDEQVTVSVAIMTREVDADGKETMKPTPDFSVFPTEVVVPPKGVQVVRAKWVGAAAPKSELSYRLVAEETPLKTRRDTPGASIYMTVRYVGSLYVVPRGVKSDVQVLSAQPVTAADGTSKLELLVENRGTAHAIISEPALTVTAGGVTKKLDTAALNGSLPGENVLAQHQRRFVVAWPEGLPHDAVKADLSFTPER